MTVSAPAFIFHKIASSGAVCSFDAAYAAVHEDISFRAADSDIFAAHLEILEDPMLQETVQEFISEGLPEKDAVEAAGEQICSLFADIDDEYLRARVDDVRDIFSQILSKMDGVSVEQVQIPDGCILVAEEILPSDAAMLELSRLKGIICHKGSSTSHVCIIARQQGIPINVGVDISGICDGDIVQVDDPLVGSAADIVAKVRKAGCKLYCNAGSVAEVQAAIEAGADGIGLFRTEFLFLDRQELPSEEEQTREYAAAISACKGRPITIRTLDIGGDKPLPGVPMQKEDNPFLGLRGIRLCLARPEILRTQLRAIVRAASKGSVRIMLPMVTSTEEVYAVREMLQEMAPDGVQLGIMIETPAAALCASELASCCDFFSVGSNDLTQYIMAADRGNAQVSYLYDSYSPAVQKVLRMVAAEARKADIPCGICGELASDPAATDLLLEAGFTSLSINKI